MARGDQLARQWKIVQIMLTSRMGKSAGDLAAELDCHPRTVYRDLSALQEAGFPIYTEKVDGRSLWSFLDTIKHHFPIPFSLPELMALYFGRDVLKVLKGTVFFDSLQSLFEKVRTTLPPESKQYLAQLEKSLKTAPQPYKQYDTLKDIIQQVNEAVMQRKRIEIVYYAMHRRKISRRKVSPYKLWFHEGTFYLIGHCSWTDEVRTFAVDRIKMLHPTGEGFELPPNFDIDLFMQHSFGVFTGEPTAVKIWFAPEVAGYIKEKTWHASQEIQELKDGAILFEAEVAGIDEIKFWVRSWGPGALVLAPDSLREALHNEATLMLERYRNGLEPRYRSA
jgi:predicted DNA-binding transcriptional regulator YafY